MPTLKDQTAVVGVGATPYYKRGESLPQTSMELAGKAVLAALADAGLTADDLDGFALYSMGFDTSLFAQWLGVPDVRFTAMLTGGGGGAAGSVGLAAAAITSGMAECVVSVMTLQQAASRFGASFAPRGSASNAMYSAPPSPEGNFLQPSGLMAPGPDVRGARSAPHAPVRHDSRALLRGRALDPRQRGPPRDVAHEGAAHPRAVLRGPHDLRPAVPLRLLPGVRRRRRGGDDHRRAGEGSPPPARLRDGVRATAGTGAGGRRSPGWACRTTSSRRRGTDRSRGGCTRWPASGRPRSTSPCSTTTSRPMVIMQLEDYGFCGIGEGGPVRRRRQHPLAGRRDCPSTPTAATCPRRTSSG